jgi:hypothetical protein
VSEISKKEAVLLFEELSRNGLSSVTFTAEGTTLKFMPAASGRNMLKVFYLVALLLPHVVYFVWGFSENSLWNSVLYGVFVLLGILISLIFAVFLPLEEIVIDPVKGEIELIPKDAIGKYLKKTKYIRIADVSGIDRLDFKTKSGRETYIRLHTKKGSVHRLFALNSWENVTKIKAAFSALVFNKSVLYDDSSEPSVRIDKTLQKLKNEKDGETSYLPLVMLLLALLLLVVGFIIYLSLGKPTDFCAPIDGLTPVILKYSVVCFGFYAIPLFFASRTPYQRRRKASLKTFVVLGAMAVGGIYMLCSGIIRFCNVKLDASQPVIATAAVIDSYYHTGSRNSSGYYVIVVQPEGSTQQVSVKHNNIVVHRDLGKQVNVSVYEGYFKKRWLRVDAE